MSADQHRKNSPANSRPHFSRRFRPFLTVVLPLLGALHIYLGWRLIPALDLGLAGQLTGIALLMASSVLLPLGMLARFVIAEETLADRIGGLGSLIMGFFSTLLVLTVLREGVLLFDRASSVSRATAEGVLGLALAITLIGYVNARRTARVVSVDIPLTGLPLPLEGMTIALISDIHVGATIKRDYVEAIVERVNALQADVIAIAGDVVDGSVRQLAPHTAPLAALRARHGVFFVTGNHEYYSGATEWIAEFRRLGLHCLLNEHVVLKHDGAALVLAGVTDYSAGSFDPSQQSDPIAALAGSPPQVPRILLAHQPRSAVAAAAAGFDLQLSGHTHGGQFWPWNMLVTLQQPFVAGLHRIGRLWVYTSRGTGYWGPPKRFGAPSEITRIRLLREAVSVPPRETPSA